MRPWPRRISGQERLCDSDLSDDVNLELCPQVGYRLKLDWPRLDDAGVVD